MCAPYLSVMSGVPICISVAGMVFPSRLELDAPDFGGLGLWSHSRNEYLDAPGVAPGLLACYLESSRLEMVDMAGSAPAITVCKTIGFLINLHAQ